MIPYLLVLCFIGRPLYFLELAMGQFASKSSVKIWDMAPFFRGMYAHKFFMSTEKFGPGLKYFCLVQIIDLNQNYL